MNAVPDPVFGRRALTGVIENLLKMHQGGMMLCRQFRDDPLTLFDSCRPRLPVLLDIAYRERERLTEYQPQIGIHGAGVREQFVVYLLILIQGNAEVVIDADENAEYIGFQVERILLPSALQISDFVAADAPVDKIVIIFGESRAIFGGDEERVPMPQDVVGVCAAAPIAIRNGIALKEDTVHSY